MLVEVGMALDRVAEAFEHDAFGGEPLLEDVADPVEGRAVVSGEHDLRKRRRGEHVERDLCLPGAALDLECASALLELRRER